MLSPTREKKSFLGFFRTINGHSSSVETTPRTTARSHEQLLTPPQSPTRGSSGQALTTHPENPVNPDQAGEPTNVVSESAPANISLAPEKARSAVSKASVARGSTIIREINKIRFKKGPGHDHGNNADREFWSKTLSPVEYEYLLERVHNDPKLGDYFDEQLRYEYSTSKSLFTILMTVGALHGSFVGQLNDLIADLKGCLRRGIEGYEDTPEPLRREAPNIRARGDAKVYFEEVLDTKQPDGSYFFRACKQVQPSLVIEVSWSHHSSAELADRARELINLSNGKIRTVLNVNLHDIYRESDEGKTLEENSEGPAAATVSLWRARHKDVNGRQVLMPECDYDEAFRDVSGNAVDSFKLCLFLSDFICEEHAKRLPGCQQVQIEITARQLCDIYDVAVEQHVLERGAKVTNPPVVQEDDVHDESWREEDIHAEAVREEHAPVADPQPKNRRSTRRVIQEAVQKLRRSERHGNKVAA